MRLPISKSKVVNTVLCKINLFYKTCLGESNCCQNVDESKRTANEGRQTGVG